jgi:hypothetical protein
MKRNAQDFQYDDNTPLRIDIAAKIAFPDESMGPPGLRKERDAGRLVTELIAGKEYVTLKAIADMRELCRGRRKGSTDAKHPSDQPSSALAAALATARTLKRSP